MNRTSMDIKVLYLLEIQLCPQILPRWNVLKGLCNQ